MSQRTRGGWIACLGSALGIMGFLTTLAPPQALQPKMGDPLSGLTADEFERFELGREKFNMTLQVEQGLGPIFNKQSCGNCHSIPTVGGPGTQAVTRFGRAEKGVPFDPLAELGGSLRQAVANEDMCTEFVPPEANVTTPRITTSSLGVGLIEAIPDATLLDLANGQDPGVQGVPHRVAAFEDPPGSPARVGRFGWKAQVATVLTFSADAALNEMGLTNRFIPTENAPNGDQNLLMLCDTVPDPEDGPALGDGVDFIDRVTDFQRYLAPPPQTPRAGMTGAAVFDAIGCADCHHATYVTPDDPSLESALRQQTIHPYSDFLLHDVGILGDGIVQGMGTEQLMRTSPLWGLRARPRLLHDGRANETDFAERVTSAVGWHFGQALPAQENYNNLSPDDLAALLAFLDSLGRAEFDLNGDEVVDEEDFQAFVSCFTGPGSFYTPDDPCSVADLDQDGDVDLDDFDGFLLAYEGDHGIGDCNNNGTLDLLDILLGGANDCNANATPDSCDIEFGEALDQNGDGVPDACEASFVRGDCDGNGLIALEDALYHLGILFLSTGDPIPCADACDVNDDGLYTIVDPVVNLNAQFVPGTPPPPAPYPECGPDGTPGDGFNCASFSACP